MQKPYYLRQNDHGETITGICTDAAGNPTSISGATIKFMMAGLDGTVAINADASNDQVDGSTTGNVSYQWQPGDTANVGFYLAVWQVNYSDGSTQTFPNPGYVPVRITKQV